MRGKGWPRDDRRVVKTSIMFLYWRCGDNVIRNRNGEEYLSVMEERSVFVRLLSVLLEENWTIVLNYLFFST